MLYTTLKIIHLLCACVVVGYLIYDVFIISGLKKTRSEAEFTALKREILKRSAFILGFFFLALLISGAFMAHFYLGFDVGFWQNNFQKILVIKTILVLSLFVFAGISFGFLALGKKDPFRRFYHLLALIICVLAVILAKLLLIF